MSEHEQKDMSGVLFKNDRRRNGKEDPHLRGSCTIGGQRFWMDARTNTVQRGERQGDKYISIKFRAAEDRRERTPRPPVADSDDVPF
jgi:hypothetical protein